jgi:RNA polymerase sigma factor (sigma-70 family)
MKLDTQTRDAILSTVPSLRAFAVSLCGNLDRADDLVQETLTRALANIDSFRPGTNMAAWLFTILRNQFRSEYRKRRREVEDAEGTHAATLQAPAEQLARVEFEELRQALSRLPDDQHLRLRRRHHQEPRQPRPHGPRQADVDDRGRVARTRRSNREDRLNLAPIGTSGTAGR